MLKVEDRRKNHSCFILLMVFQEKPCSLQIHQCFFGFFSCVCWPENHRLLYVGQGHWWWHEEEMYVVLDLTSNPILDQFQLTSASFGPGIWDWNCKCCFHYLNRSWIYLSKCWLHGHDSFKWPLSRCAFLAIKYVSSTADRTSTSSIPF